MNIGTVEHAEYVIRVWLMHLKRIDARLSCGFTRAQCEEGIALWTAKLLEARSAQG
jgi:hypothetical protein